MFKKIITLLLLLPTFLFAHEFWISPNKFRLAVGELISLNFYVGESFQGEIWANRSKRTLKLTHFSKSGKKDLTDLATEKDSIDMLLSFENEGTHLLAMESKNSYVEMEAEAFNGYLKEDGMENIYQLREKNGDLDKPSKESYRRCAKTLIQVGVKTDQTYKLVTGMDLEIVPLSNPYTLKMGDEMTVKVLYKGKPLANNAIFAWNKTADAPTRLQAFKTDKKGKVKFPLDQKGVWMVSLVRMEALPEAGKADYQSYWGSLTFEF